MMMGGLGWNERRSLLAAASLLHLQLHGGATREVVESQCVGVLDEDSL